MAFSVTQNELTNILQDKQVVIWSSVVLALVAVYAGSVPTNILRFVKLWYVQLVLFLAIAYVNEQNNTVGLLATIMVIMLLMTAYRLPTSETFCGSYGNKVKDSNAEYMFMPYGDIKENVVDKKQMVHESLYAKNAEKYAYEVDKNKSEHSTKPHFEAPYADEKVQHMDDMPEMQLNDTNVGDVDYEERNADSKPYVTDKYQHDEKPSMYNEKPLMYNEKPAEHDEKPSMYGDKYNKPVREAKYVSDVIDEVTKQLEYELGVKLHEQQKTEIKKEVIKKVTEMGTHKHVHEYDVVRVCREIYKRRL